MQTGVLGNDAEELGRASTIVLVVAWNEVPGRPPIVFVQQWVLGWRYAWILCFTGNHLALICSDGGRGGGLDGVQGVHGNDNCALIA